MWFVYVVLGLIVFAAILYLLDADGVGRLELSDGADRRRRNPYGDVRSGENRDE